MGGHRVQTCARRPRLAVHTVARGDFSRLIGVKASYIEILSFSVVSISSECQVRIARLCRTRRKRDRWSARCFQGTSRSRGTGRSTRDLKTYCRDLSGYLKWDDLVFPRRLGGQGMKPFFKRLTFRIGFVGSLTAPVHHDPVTALMGHVANIQMNLSDPAQI